MNEHAHSPGEMGNSALENEVQALRAKLRKLESENLAFRKALWLLHGHVGIYGDDGEMQCGECIKFGEPDYKRGDAAHVITAATRVIQYLHGLWEESSCGTCGQTKPCKAFDGIIMTCQDCWPASTRAKIL